MAQKSSSLPPLRIDGNNQSKGAASSTEPFFSIDSDRKAHQLKGIAIFLRSCVEFDTAVQTKGKSPKFRGSDAVQRMINIELVENEREGCMVMQALQEAGWISPSKGSTKSLALVDRNYRFMKEVAIEGKLAMRAVL